VTVQSSLMAVIGRFLFLLFSCSDTGGDNECLMGKGVSSCAAGDALSAN
jgi:hypothetical protein